jgi:hypothetical protein
LIAIHLIQVLTLAARGVCSVSGALLFGVSLAKINNIMSTTSISNALDGGVPVGTEITIQGWVRTRRDSKAGFSFVNVHDGSCFDPIQVVAPGELDNYQNEILRLTAGCALRCTGTLVESGGRGQSYEIQADKIEVVGWISDPDTYPIQPKQHSFEFLREVAHLRARTNTFGAVTRIRHAAAQAIHRFFDGQKPTLYSFGIRNRGNTLSLFGNLQPNARRIGAILRQPLFPGR